MELKLKDKVALVTGASRGLGEAICHALAAEGVKVGVNDLPRAEEQAQAVVDELTSKYGVQATLALGDLAQEDDILKMFALMQETYGGLDILVNNAAYLPKGWITDYTKDEWDLTFSVNVSGVFVACREMVRQLTAAGKPGKIVNIASQAAFRGSTTGHLPYDSSKGAIVSLTLALAREVSAKGINVNAVAPGMIMTEMVAKTWEQNKERYLARIPIKRIATTAEVANVVVFLASDAASYIVGSTVDVSGGVMLR